MRCPICLAPTSVAETRDATSVRWAVARVIAEHYPDAILRRRICPEHGTVRTIEVTVDDFFEAQFGKKA